MNIFNQLWMKVAFTATQIPNIDGRIYPAELAGHLYPQGINIYPETELASLIQKFAVEEVVFAYSDVPYDYVMSKSAIVNAAGAAFKMLGPHQTMLKSKKPVVAVCAVRTGCGKSQTTRRVSKLLQEHGKKVVAVRHPMPYEPHISAGTVIYAGVDYGAILHEAEKEADVILWDGGNNDLPFYKPDLHIVLVDPHRPGDELFYYPGEANLRMADVVVINKIDSADPQNVLEVRQNISMVNSQAMVIDAASPIFVENYDQIRGKRVLVVEDGPTLTHGEMAFGAGVVAAEKYGALELVDPREFTVGSISDTFAKYPDIGLLLPAMGYGDEQVRDLEKTIENSDADLVIIGTPIDLRKIVKINKPALRVYYELQEIGKPTLLDALKKIL
jgi:predicted GTPase